MIESKEIFKKAKDNILNAVLDFFIMMLLKVFMIILTVGSSINYFGEQEIVFGGIYAVLAIIWVILVFIEIKLLILKIKNELKELEILNSLNETQLKIYESQKIEEGESNVTE